MDCVSNTNLKSRLNHLLTNDETRIHGERAQRHTKERLGETSGEPWRELWASIDGPVHTGLRPINFSSVGQEKEMD